MQIETSKVNDDLLCSLSAQLNQSSQEIAQLLTNPYNRLCNFVDKHFSSSLPIWVERHIHLLQQLQLAILNTPSSTAQSMPSEATQSLAAGRKILHLFLPDINYDLYLQCIQPTQQFIDKHGLLISTASAPADTSIPECKESWYQNLGLLHRIYAKCPDESLKKKIAFLVFNYLAKSAPICPEDMNIPIAAKEKLSEQFQRPLQNPGIGYNREGAMFNEYFREALNKKLAKASGQVFFLLDTKEIADLLPLGFAVLNTPGKHTQDAPEVFDAISEAWISGFYQHLRKHTSRYPQNPLEYNIETPLLIDLTALLENRIQTGDEEQKNRDFEQCLRDIESLMEKALEIAIQKLVTDENLRRAFKIWTLANLTCICRCETLGVGVIKILPLFYDPKHMLYSSSEPALLGYRQNNPEQLARLLWDHKLSKSKADMDNFLNATGLRLGSIQGRMKTFEAISLEDFLRHHKGISVTYYPQGANSLYFSRRQDVLNTALFKRWEERFDSNNIKSQQLLSKHPYLKVLGHATLKLLKGLLQEISDAAWEQLHQDPVHRELIQNALVQIHHHLAAAERYRKEFAKFTDAIELIHYEIAQLLFIMAPFKRADFGPILRTSLGHSLPTCLHPYIQAGISKSAMNTMAGVCAAIQKTSKSAVKIYDENSHFEIVQFVAPSTPASDPSRPSKQAPVDLYLGEYHHNVKLLYTHDSYQLSDVTGQVETLLAASDSRHALTVTLDATIDFIQSKHIQEFLEHFSQQIQNGRLNVVIFRSGQKFDMLGMDDYYGSCFYMINNGQKHWQAFQELFTHEAYTCDDLSFQWFCLSYKYIRQDLDAYRQLIFENTRQILNQAPSVLLPGGNPNIKLAQVSSEMNPCFLDIKCYGNDAIKLLYGLEKRLFQLFTKRDVKIHARGGYGYFNPTVNLFLNGLDKRNDYATLRINPGIDPTEIELIVKFLHEAAKLAAPSGSVGNN